MRRNFVALVCSTLLALPPSFQIGLLGSGLVIGVASKAYADLYNCSAKGDRFWVYRSDNSWVWDTVWEGHYGPGWSWEACDAQAEFFYDDHSANLCAALQDQGAHYVYTHQAYISRNGGAYWSNVGTRLWYC